MIKKAIVSIVLVICILGVCFTLRKPDKGIYLTDPNYEKVSQTDVYTRTYSDNEGNTLEYHICHTTYFTSANTVSGLNIDALRAAFNVDHTPVLRELKISGHPAAFYKGETHTCLCCTPSPEDSLVLEYESGAVSEEEAIRIIQSVFKNPTL